MQRGFQSLEHPFDTPTVSVYASRAARRQLADGGVGQQPDRRLSVVGGLLELEHNPTHAQASTLSIDALDALSGNLARLDSTHRLRRSKLRRTRVAPVFAD